jgi:hypothetical protein
VTRFAVSRYGPPTVSPAGSAAELGPCSLDPDRSFWSAFAELIRDQTSPADFCNIQRRASNQTRARDPRRDGGLDLLPFLTCHALFLAEAVTRGEPRFVRSQEPQCWFLPLAWVCPAVMPRRTPHHERRCWTPLAFREDGAHGSKDRAKDASSHGARCASARCMRLVAHADGVPLLGDLRTSAVAGA